MSYRPFLAYACLHALSCIGPGDRQPAGPVERPELLALDSLIGRAAEQESRDASLGHALAMRAMRMADSLGDPARKVEAAITYLYTAVQLDSMEAYARMEPRIRQLHDPLGDRVVLARHLRRMGEAHYRKGIVDKAGPYFEESIAMARAAEAGGELAEALNSWGSLALDIGSPAEAIALQRQALHVLDSIGMDSMPRIRVLGNIGYAMATAGRPDSAIRYHEAAIGLIGDTGPDRALAWNLLNLGTAYADKGLYNAALGHLQRAHDLHARAGMPFEVAACLYYMAYCHQQVSPPQKVIQAYERMIAINDSLGMPHRSMLGHAQLGRFLIDLDSARCAGNGLTLADRNALALKHGRLALSIVRTTDYVNQMSDILNALCDVERVSGELDSALAHAHEAIRIRELMDSPGRAADSYKDLGMVLHAMGRHREAEQALLTGLERSARSPIAQIEVALHNALQALYADMGRHKDAYRHLALTRTLEGSMLSETQRQELVQRDLQWDFDRERLADSLASAQRLKAASDQRTIAELKAGRAETRSWAIATGGLLLLAGGGIIYALDRKRRRERFAKEAARLETKALRAQMDPHFIGNTLHAVNGYLLSNDPGTASTLLSRFSKWIRNTLESSRHEEVPLRDDIAAMRTYLALEQARTRDKFTFHVDVPEDDTVLRTRIPPMLVQPFIENAIQHGVLPREGEGHIRLQVLDRDDRLLIVVEDDGVGRNHRAQHANEEGTMQEHHTSLSTTITRERLQLLSERSGRPAEVRVIDLEQGTRVEVEVPV